MNHFTFPSSASTAFARKQQQIHQQRKQQNEVEDESVNTKMNSDPFHSLPRRSPNYTISSNEGFDFSSTITEKDQLLSPISNNSPWNHLPNNNDNNNIATSNTPPDLGLFYNRAANTPSPSNQKANMNLKDAFSNRGTNMMASSSSSGVIGSMNPGHSSSSSSNGGGGRASGSGFYSAGGGMRLAPAIEDDDEDRLFFQRDPMFLPRRNHTIALGSSKYGRKIERQFPPFPATSPGKNSLSAITGGKEEGDDDWEAMMKRKESLIPNVDEETEVLDSSTWQPISLNTSSHKRFPSQPVSTFGTSPIDSHHSPISNSSNSLFQHQRSESAHASSLAQGPFASSPIIPGSAFGSNTGIVRRHQSLNYHAGRNMANRMNHGRRQEAIGSGAKVHSPVISTSTEEQMQSHSPQNSMSGTRMQNGQQIQINLMERFDNTLNQNQNPHPSQQISPSLMDVHAQMARMSLFNNSEANIPNSPKQSFSEIRPKLPSLVTNREVLAKSRNGQNDVGGVLGGGPASASAYVPPIGHGHHRQSSSTSIAPSQFPVRGDNFGSVGRQNTANHREPQTAFPTSQSRWQTFKDEIAGTSIRSSEQKEDETSSRSVQAQGVPWAMDSSIMRRGNLNETGNEEGLQKSMGHPSSNPNLIASLQNPFYQMGATGAVSMYNNNIPTMAGMPTNVNEPIRLGRQHPQIWNNLGQAYGASPNGIGMMRPPQNVNNPIMTQNQQQSNPNKLTNSSLMDSRMRTLIASKGYNPPLTSFNIDPPRARFFVIKSFTEDDVQRSLKHEIWASTEKGNQRLDRAFKESSQDGPLYLFFSVNASGHFCGIAEMLTSIDFTSDSNVWVQEGKWKGTFKVRWIYVKDVPNNKLRHIRLTNTAECKPITQSRDTQELPPDGGRQALKIIAEYQSRTTLLQDWVFSESQADQQQSENRTSLQPQSQSVEFD